MAVALDIMVRSAAAAGPTTSRPKNERTNAGVDTPNASEVQNTISMKFRTWRRLPKCSGDPA
jgi:hypothetical protein